MSMEKTGKPTLQRYALHTSEHAFTGYSPFYLMFGRKAKIPLDIIYGNPTTLAATTPPEYVQNLRSSLQHSYRNARKLSLEAAC